MVCLHILIHIAQALIDALEAIVLGINLINAGQTRAPICNHAATEVQLVIISYCVAEQRGYIIEGLGHDELHFAGMYVDLNKYALGVNAVLLTVEEGAVENRVKLCAHDVLVEVMTHYGIHG